MNSPVFYLSITPVYYPFLQCYPLHHYTSVLSITPPVIHYTSVLSVTPLHQCVIHYTITPA